MDLKIQPIWDCLNMHPYYPCLNGLHHVKRKNSKMSFLYFNMGINGRCLPSWTRMHWKWFLRTDCKSEVVNVRNTWLLSSYLLLGESFCQSNHWIANVIGLPPPRQHLLDMSYMLSISTSVLKAMIKLWMDGSVLFVIGKNGFYRQCHDLSV